MSEIKIPRELVKDIETINSTIEFLKLYKRILEGKTISSDKGLINKIKYNFLGYVLDPKDLKDRVEKR